MTDMQAIVDQKLAPGKNLHSNKESKHILVASVAFGNPGNEVDHAMVLDTYDSNRDVLIFKNTYDNPESGQPKKFEIERTHANAPKKFYFVHIHTRDMALIHGLGQMENLPSQKQRETKTTTLNRIV